MENVEKINNTQSGRGYLLRVSASDLCNFDCNFCHPSQNESVTKLTDEEFLKVFECINKLYKLKTLHFTGGEPLMRRSLPEVIKKCRQIAGEDLDIAMTTNASLLRENIDKLLEAGLNRANISLHSIDSEKYKKFTGRNVEVDYILDTICEAKSKGLKIKINSVVIRNFNHMDIVKMAKFCFEENIIPRFLELGIYGPVAQWYSQEDQFTHQEILEIMEKEFGHFERDFSYRGNGPSKYYKNEKGYVFGILDNQSDKMCRGCDRFRMSANGYIKVCNFLPIDLRPYINSEEDLKRELLKLGEYLDSRGKDYIGKRLHRNDYNFRWNHPEKNLEEDK